MIFEMFTFFIFLLICLTFLFFLKRYDMSSNWSETGDRYLLKLFRDYVFHQVYEDGNPYIDFAHVIDCLNKVHFLVSFRISVDD